MNSQAPQNLAYFLWIQRKIEKEIQFLIAQVINYKSWMSEANHTLKELQRTHQQLKDLAKGYEKAQKKGWRKVCNSRK